MKVVVKKAGQKPEIKEIPNELHAFQEIVGGYIETIMVTNDPIICVCNGEGKLKGLTPNFLLAGDVDVIVGDVFFCGTDEFDFCSLTDEQIDLVMTILNLFELRKREN